MSRSKSNTETIYRQWEMMKQLPTSGAGMSALSLTRILNSMGFKVSKRTVERDLKRLQSVFDIECNVRSKPFGWRWKDDALTEMQGLSITDAIGWHFINKAIQPLIPDQMLESFNSKIQSVYRQLSVTGQYSIDNWLNKIAYVSDQISLQSPKLDPDVLYSAQFAVINEERLKGIYKGIINEIGKVVELHPLALIQKGTLTYLVARPIDEKKEKLYALHRFTELDSCLGEVHRGDFKLREYIQSGAMQYGEPRPISIEAIIDPVLERMFQETPLSEQQNIKPLSEERFILKAKVTYSWQLKWWLVSRCEHIEVTKPISLREEVIETLHKGLNNYQ